MIDGRTGDKAVGRKQTGTTAARLFIGTNQRLQVASGVRGDKAHNSDPKKEDGGPSKVLRILWPGRGPPLSAGRQIESQMEIAALWFIASSTEHF